MVRSGGFAAATPRLAMTIPEPLVRAKKFETGKEVLTIMVLIWAEVRPGLADLIRAAMAAAWGAAAEVPKKEVKPGTPVGTPLAAVKSTLDSVVPPFVPNKRLPGVIGAPVGS